MEMVFFKDSVMNSVMDLDFYGCMGRLQNFCHSYPVFCFMKSGAACKKP